LKRRDARALDHKTLQGDSDSCGGKSASGREPRNGDPSAGLYPKLHLHLAGEIPQRGWGALKARALKGRPMKIKAAQMRWLYRTVTGKSPLQFRFEFALWTRR